MKRPTTITFFLISMASLLLVTGCGDSNGGNSERDISTLEKFCKELACEVSRMVAVCEGGTFDFECTDPDLTGSSLFIEIDSDCVRNANERMSGSYTESQGKSCLDDIEGINCGNIPLNCKDNLATEACNNFLDGQTNGVDPECP